ncbi:transposase [Streptomyces malaysiensis]|uniref:transposase n=1 Tax=Streptomyces malaysiensis TaxID=92644 RepID=UPI00371DCA9D
MSIQIRHRAARERRITLIGPVKPKTTRKSRKGNVFDRDAFTIDWDNKQVTCPQGHTSTSWLTPVSVAPYIHAKFAKRDCLPCPLKPQCTRSEHRLVGFLPRELKDLQTEARAEQQTRPWQRRYALRAGIEGAISEFVHGHGMRQSRNRSQGKAHVQHVLTAIAINIERVAAHGPLARERPPRTPTALQGFLDWQRIPQPRIWRATG